MTLLEKLAQNVIRNPEKIAIYTDKGAFTYREVAHITNEIANAISARFPQSGVVSLYLNHSYRIIFAILGVLKAGCTCAPVT